MLFFKECRKVLFSLPFALYFAATAAMYFTQFDSDLSRGPLQKPVAGLESYGMTVREIPELVMSGAAESLVGEYLSGSFQTYPYGFLKNVRLKERDRTRMAQIIQEICGLTEEELESFGEYEEGGFSVNGDGVMVYHEAVLPQVRVVEGISYEAFRERMREADRILGGGSRYSDARILEFSGVPKTYEEALEEYEQFLKEDGITGAYARLYCDYLGIVLGILPVFPAVALAGMDARAGMEAMVYSRRISSLKLIFTRYFALVAALHLPVAFTAVLAHVKTLGLYPGAQVDPAAIFLYALWWLSPNILIAAAVGMLFTELASGFLGIFVQGVWWFFSVMASAEGLTGAIGRFTLVMRHNSLLGRGVFQAELGNVVFNRIFFTALSLAAVGLTAGIFECKRRGRYHGSVHGGKHPGRKHQA